MAVEKRTDGRKLRRCTIYLPEDLSRKLSIHCAVKETTRSEVVEQAVSAFFSDKRKKQP